MAVNKFRVVSSSLVAFTWGILNITQVVPTLIYVDVFIYLLSLVIFMMSIPAPWIVPRYGQPLLTRDLELRLMQQGTINDFRIIGTHNSTHQCNVFSALFVKMWRYSHSDLSTQLELGLRSIEVDIWYNIATRKWELKHEILVDDLTSTGDHCVRSAFLCIRRWSLQHAGHFPLIVNLDIKGAYRPLTGWLAPFLGRGFHPGSSYEAEAFGVLKSLISEIWESPGCIFTPRSLPVCTDKQLWPTAESLAGQTMFLLNTYGGKSSEKADASFFFIRGHDVTSDTTQLYYENDLHVASAKGLLTRSLCESRSATFVAVDDLQTGCCAPESLLKSSLKEKVLLLPLTCHFALYYQRKHPSAVNMPSAAEEAWTQLCHVVGDSLTEIDLILMSLTSLRSLLAHHGFTPLTAARAEVQWQVLQTTQGSAKKRGYEVDMTKAVQAEMEHLSPLREGTPSPVRGPASVQSRGISPSRTASPRRRELGSRDGVASPRSLRKPRLMPGGPIKQFQYPVLHGRDFEVPKTPRGAHLSRRANLSPRGTLGSDVDGDRSLSRRRIAGKAIPAATSNPNELSRVPTDMGGIAIKSRTFPAHADPNSTSFDIQDRRDSLGLRTSERNQTSSGNPFTGALGSEESTFRPSKVLMNTGRKAAVGNPNELSHEEKMHQLVKHSNFPPPAHCDPNPTELSIVERTFVGRKGKVADAGATTDERIPRFVPTAGPLEQGVFPGTHSWQHSDIYAAHQRKGNILTTTAAVADPNNIIVNDGTPTGRGHIGTSASQLSEVLVSTVREKPTKISTAFPAVLSEPSTGNPNTMSKSLPQTKGVTSQTPADAWRGPSDAPDNGTQLRPAKRPGSPKLSCSHASHSFYSRQKSDHLVTHQTPSVATSSPRVMRDWSPRFVPGRA